MADNNARTKSALATRSTNSTGVTKTVKDLLSQDSVKNRFAEILGKKAAGFTSSVITVVNRNPELQKSDPQSVLAAAAIAASLDLPIDPNLGFAYIIPYRGKAQFQMGYKGFIQLAMRTAAYKTINACEVYEGEIKSHNRVTGEMEFDFDAGASNKIIGYVSYFKLINGFEKYHYMTLEQLEKHAKSFSQTYKKGYGLWKDDFHSMALKTVLKLLLSKYGILSIEMQTSLNADQAIVKDAGDGESFDFEYVDTEGGTVDDNPNPADIPFDTDDAPFFAGEEAKK